MSAILRCPACDSADCHEIDESKAVCGNCGEVFNQAKELHEPELEEAA